VDALLQRVAELERTAKRQAAPFSKGGPQEGGEGETEKGDRQMLVPTTELAF